MGLMLVVTFVANYLTTTLPQYMAVNDVNHDLLVENEVGHAAALLSAVASKAATDRQLTQPFQLGSLGLPPFASADGSVIGPAAGGSSEQVRFSLSGPFNPPSPGVPNTGHYTSKCSVSGTNDGKPTGISCTGSTTAEWNFSAGDGLVYSVSGNGGLGATMNFTTNRSLISVGSVGGASDRIYVLGSNNTIYVNGTGGASVSVIVVGSYNTLVLDGKGGAGFTIYLVGSYNSVSTSTTGGGAVLLIGYGRHDSFTGSGTGATVYYTGFAVSHGSALPCPNSNSGLTDTVAGTAGTVTYNDTTYSSGSHTGNASGWVYHYDQVSQSSCPFVSYGSIFQSSVGGGFSVLLENRYAPVSEVAYDYGAVVFAQQDGIPLFVDPPSITLEGGGATIWMPVFTSSLGEEAGTGTAILSFRETSEIVQTFPSGGFNLTSGVITVTITTPFATAWVAYLNANPAFAGHVSCTPVGSAVCSASGRFTTTGPLGHVTISLPATSVTLEVASFTLSLS